ncbi:MAG: DUF1553 domain-containing protein [Planctomycetota bacterium]
MKLRSACCLKLACQTVPDDRRQTDRPYAAKTGLPSIPAIVMMSVMVFRAGPLSAQTSDTATTARIDYQTEVRHVLQDRCFACHGALKQEGQLRLDTAMSAKQGGDSGPAVLPGDADASLLVQRISATDLAVRMPPEGESLKPAEISAIRSWIQQGAIAPEDEQPEEDPRDHWSFRSPVRPPVPSVAAATWIRNPIDAFVAARHQEMGLTAQPEADRRVWLRRVTLDLIGVPPTLDDMNSFLADASDEAYERVVDRLLSSPMYAERWARHWMDIWRYSDWWGLGAEVRNSQKHIWHWRDWIIESLEADLSYDQMLREMLAADELYPNDMSRLRASGYLARQYFKFNRTSWLDSTIEHTGKSMLGLTFNCAKCHDHKYDPFSQDEYYQLRAIFEPYQLRTDFVAGVLDPEQNGIPRAFDCNADTATFVHIRGDDRNPETSRPISPDIPAFLGFMPFEIQPVELPPEAVQPGLRSAVIETLLHQAETRITEAAKELDQARTALHQITETSQKPATKTTTAEPSVSPLVSEDFAAERPELWEVRGGRWSIQNGHLTQTDIGASRRSLRLRRDVPQDFEATLKYVPTGGEMWKSVGITFDAHSDHADVTVYLSSYAGGPKVQASYRTSGDSVYPPDGAENRPVNLNETHELKIKVRDTLVNVFVNGQRSVSYRLPIERKSGPLELMTFDAAVILRHFELKPLSPLEPMVDPASGKPSQPASPEEARLTVIAAEKSLAAARREPELIRKKAMAERARLVAPNDPETKAHVADAARAEQEWKVATAEWKAVESELNLLRSPADQKMKAEERLKSDRAALDEAQKALTGTADLFTPLVGSQKTLENNLETEESRRKPFPRTSTGRRTALARWVTDRKNPLTARVAVNHLWNRHFGRGLVPTVFDFGRKGAKPTHPELLDWLAVEFMDHDWSMKYLHRLIVLSGTYRMSSSSLHANPQNLQSDVDNHFLWRRNPIRMEAQVVRDSLLSLANQLDLTRGGPSIPANDDSSRRRSLYYVHSHNDHQPFLSMFDDAGVLECYRRAESIVPQQALALENSPLASTMAEQIARRLESLSGESVEQTSREPHVFIEMAFQLILSVPPTTDEIAACEQALKDFSYAETTPQTSTEPAESTNSRARIRLIQALLNHNDFITIR